MHSKVFSGKTFGGIHICRDGNYTVLNVFFPCVDWILKINQTGSGIPELKIPVPHCDVIKPR